MEHSARIFLWRSDLNGAKPEEVVSFLNAKRS